jgi:ATP-binding cassette, subfamily C, bacterial LapB
MSNINELMTRLRSAAPAFAPGSPDAAVEHGTDLLAAAIADIARHHGLTVSVQQITSGLPLVGGHLPLEHLGDACHRAGLVGETVQAEVALIADAVFPVLVLLADGGVDIAWSAQRHADGSIATLEMSEPGRSTARAMIPAGDAGLASAGRIVLLKPKSRRDADVAAIPAAHRHDWFLDVFRSSRRIYAEAIAATLAINLLALAMPLFTMNVYDRVLPNAAVDTLWALSIGVVLATLFDLALKSLRGLFVDTASRRSDVVLANYIYGRLLGARLPNRQVSAGVRANTLREFESLRDFFNSATLTAFGDLPFLVLFLIVMAMVAGPLALIAVVSIPLIIAVGWLTQRRLERLTQAAFKETAQKNAVVVETLVGLETIKATGAESAAASRWEQAVAEHIRTGFDIRQQSNVSMHLVQACQSLIQVAMIVVGFYLVAAGQISTGALIAATMLAGRALGPVGTVAMLLTRLHQARIAYTSISEIVHAPQERADNIVFVSKPAFDGAIAFEGVSFVYEQDAAPALRDVSFEIRPGERVGFIGGIGSGKTTLLKLIPALHLPGQGRVLVDGIGAAQIDPAVLRANAALMLQGGELFQGTIRSNITLADPGASDMAVMRAAHIAGAMDWIARLPKGLDTPVRERGGGLSGGQRQGIALARVLLKAPRILLLDEPTSDMDGRTEQAVIQRIDQAFKGHTMLLVTHRPALLDLVERLIVLDQGVKLLDGPKAEVLGKLKALTDERRTAVAKAGAA